MRAGVCLLGAFLLLIGTALARAQAAPPLPASPPPATAADTCLDCHAALGDRLGAPTLAFNDDIHRKQGLTCAACHGGDPSQADPLAAMSRNKGFVGVPPPQRVPPLCGHCHSDAIYMKRFNPSVRIDQETEYYTSVHGKLLRQGDKKVAVCTSCHAAHGILAESDPRAPVYPFNVATTCARCHANPDYMRGYSIPTDQVAKYRKSVHADALENRRDLSAPTCNSCHGNHGAAPPGVGSVSRVCGTCHVRQEELFEKSPHQAPFAAAGMAGCVTCHSNHEIRSPSDSMLGAGPDSVCLRCHSAGDAGYAAARTMRDQIDRLALEISRAQNLLARAARQGMEVSQPQFELNQAQSKLIDARVVVHGFSAEQLQADVAPGLTIAQKAQQAGQAALHDFQIRRAGLAVSLLFIFTAVVAIYLKVRQIERRSRNGSERT